MAGTQAPTGSGLLIIERILRDRDSIWKQIADEHGLGKLILQMLGSSCVAFVFYGAVMGASSGFDQAALSAVKLPLLFLMTLAICLPTLYLFNLVFGARLQVRQALALVMVTITITAVLSLAFAPISLFFLITAKNYAFYKLLNVAVLALSALVGLKFLTSGMRALNARTAAIVAAKRAEEFAEEQAMKKLLAGDKREGTDDAPVSPAPTVTTPNGAPVPVPVGHVQPGAAPAPLAPASLQPAPVLMPNGQYAYPMPQLQQMRQPQPMPHNAPPGERPASMMLLNVWILLFGFVGTQLAWTLRPFVGSPGEPFQIFRSIDGNFYVDIVRTLGNLF